MFPTSELDDKKARIYEARERYHMSTNKPNKLHGPGLKERVKSGDMTPLEAISLLSLGAEDSHTFRWLKSRCRR